ncbi:Armadillo-type fold [Pseudocohnilembus persalinus]|uniref:Armadillo-type fold n=1 Tax=Pseudocohnilembus persalinus TaxID=266149 RepID=A0A0V0QRH0_PSEPJ|nr:Armadillo-type fold [Pseudocohnilembus persalinus]|eukprot:KRX04785.1 Armadillo-type fold [Pseudocohnilembus persalinus]
MTYNNQNTKSNLQKNQPLTAQSVLQMFESQYTEQLNDRKANAIVRFCRERRDGFYYEELESLCKMLKYAINDLQQGIPEMAQSISKICEVASLPFKKTKASDELKYVPILPEFLNCFKPLLYNTYNETNEIYNQEITQTLRYYAINFLKSFSCENIDEIMQKEKNFENKKMQGYEKSPLTQLMNDGTKNLRALLESELVEDIIFTMQYYQKNYEYLLPLLDLISSCILFRDLAQKFSNFGILKDIIYVIFDCEDFRSYIVKICFEIIWNAIEAVGISCIKLFAAEDIINSLKKIFENIMKHGYKLEDKQLRNEILILINYLMSDEKALYYFNSKTELPNQNETNPTFIDILLVYATVDEITFYNKLTINNNMRAFYGTTTEDLEFKKLIWSGLLTAIQSGNSQIIETIQDSAFILSLLLYIDPLANSYAVNRWSPPQLREIQLHCLDILRNVIIYMKEDFTDKNGFYCLTKFLTNTTDHERREKCLKVFNNASLFEEHFKMKITDEGLMDNLIEFLQQDSDNPLDIKESCFSIISNLCIGCNKNKKLFRQKGGVDMIVVALKDPQLGISPRYALYAVSILDCLWNAILGNRKSEAVFLDSEGLFVLLEFLEVCQDMHKKMGLSCLSALIENPKSIPYFCDWFSGKTMINATQLLIKIYEKEDQRFGLKYQDGIITSKDRPLNPLTAPWRDIDKEKEDEIKQQAIDMFDSDEEPKQRKKQTMHMNSKGFQKLKDALEAGSADQESEVGTEAYLVRQIKEKVDQYDLRAIVFSILYRTGFDKNQLLSNEKQKIEVIQMYPHFKIGEIWTEIKYELDQQGIKPISDDQHWMVTAIEEFQEQILNCINTQSLIAREHRKQQDDQLNKFYETIRNNKVTK